MTAFTVVLSPEDDGGYSVACPAMPGAHSQGVSREDALSNIRDAMDLWREVAAERGETPVTETPALIAEQIEFVLLWKADEGMPLVVGTAVVELPTAVAAA